jgi:PKD repeat protein
MAFARRFAGILVGLASLAAVGCHKGTSGADGGRDAPASDAPPPDAPTALALDFAVTGCARAAADAGATNGDGGAAACTGTAPLTLTFSPVGSAALTRFRWTFGDLSPPSSERAPTHTYLLPGTYDVGVVAEGDAVGSISRQRPGFVVVTGDGAGTPCDVDAQCGPGLFCLCGESAPCGDEFPHGICTSGCATSACAGGASCARVDVPPPSASPDAGSGATADAVPASAGLDDASLDDAGDDAPAASDAAADAPSPGPADADAGDDAAASADGPPAVDPNARVALCLAGCTGDSDCAAGLVCRTLPNGAKGPDAGAWTSVCVPAALRRVGDSCRDARGKLDSRLCATGACADLGALGLCTASCADVACPSGAACATFGDGRSLCVATCATNAPCTSDPLLGCESGNGTGALGFRTSPPAPSATFCAPRSCTSQADCSPSGTCKPLGVGAHCVAN